MEPTVLYSSASSQRFLYHLNAIPIASEWSIGVLSTLEAEQYSSQLSPRLFNNYCDGGFVIFYAPHHHVFVDDRCELFGKEWFYTVVLAARDDDRTAQAIPRWEQRYGTFDYARVRHNIPFARYLAARPQE